MRLVEEEHLGLGDQRRGERNPLTPSMVLQGSISSCSTGPADRGRWVSWASTPRWRDRSTTEVSLVLTPRLTSPVNPAVTVCGTIPVIA